jgi:hypothetical protein
MNQASLEIRDFVWRKIREDGLDELSTDEASARAKSNGKVPLSSDSWDQLADWLWTQGLLKEPGISLVRRAGKLAAQLPKNQQRKLTVRNTKPLFDRLRRRLEEAKLAELTVRELQPAKPQPQLLTKEQVCDSLTDEEVLIYFQQRILRLSAPADLLPLLETSDLADHLTLNDLVSQTAGRLLEHLRERDERLIERLIQALTMSAPTKPPARATPADTTPNRPIAAIQPKIALIGLKSDQFQIVNDRLHGQARFYHVSKDVEKNFTVPQCQYVLIWARFCSHAMIARAYSQCGQAQIIIHREGFTTLVQRLETLIQSRPR